MGIGFDRREIYIYKLNRAKSKVFYFFEGHYTCGPDVVCFVHFDLEMCFVPQRRAMFHFSSGQMAPHPPL
jgi:hypothetical protein